MGLCLSKKQHRRQEEQPPNAAKKNSGGSKRVTGKDGAALVLETKKAPQPQPKPAPSRKAAPPRAEEPAADKRTVFVVKAAAAAAAAEVAAESDGANSRRAPAEEAKPAVVVSRVPVRTSSCTKEEVDAILIQCGRLSRSSSASGKTTASGESGGGGGHQRRYSGSKRSYDFDRDRRGGGADDELDWERHGGASRPSPRRRTPERKRSASHDGRGAAGSGSRRVSRSPGRRGDGPPTAAATSVGAARQPGKMVSVPAREKGRAPSPGKAGPEKGRAPSPVKSAASAKRYASPTLRSNSPARAAAAANENAALQATHGPSLSRSSSRKADHSPYRRNPMSELDENALVSNNNHTANHGNKSQKKPIESVAAVSHKLGIAKDRPEIVEEAVASDTKAPSSRMNATHTMSIVAESVVNPRDGPGGRSWRRSSRDFDLEGAMASDNRGPSSRINATHSVNIVAESVANPKAGPVGRSSRRSSRDFDHNGINSVAFLNEAMASEAKAPSSRMNATHTVSIVAETVANPKTGRSSRRSSRDFDHNGNSYASLLLEDIQSYHQQNTSDTTAAVAPAFSLPACVSKACSILEAVADLNSSPSENRSFELERSADDKGSVNVVVKDDLMEPSLHKYVSVRDIRGEIEPLESAGSNSFAGNPWTCSWEPNSVDSTARTWTSSQSNGDDDDVEQHNSGAASALDQSWQSKQQTGGQPQVGSGRYAQVGVSAHAGGGSVLSTRSDVRTISASSSIV
ncbi:uncharacterized protein At1g65710-like [Lolium rigidum]|uniref:uncharacterized protein At1g65710-like n=1 Tax=Lolium rigidum TaxID=89674 RepID=UPI001F5DCFE7|nr:uncharacterized protein At1g65710-like [Lolium rigidum]